MADISIQFYALPSELLALGKEISESFGLRIVALRFFPFGAVEIETAHLGELIEDSTISRLAFTVGIPCLPVSDELEFSEKNPDHLRLELGRETNSGLEESWLVARTKDPDVLATWKKIANRFKKQTQAGITAICPASVGIGEIRHLGYTYSGET